MSWGWLGSWLAAATWHPHFFKPPPKSWYIQRMLLHMVVEACMHVLVGPR